MGGFAYHFNISVKKTKRVTPLREDETFFKCENKNKTATAGFDL